VLGRVDLGSGGLGFRALNSLTAGVYNVGIGEDAGCSITTGCRNIAIGGLALATATTVNDNIGIGAEALRRNTTGCANIAIGTTSLVFTTTGISNVAIGNNAARANTTGSGNVFIGTEAGLSGDNVGRSVAIGEFSQRNAVCGQCNTSVGWSSLNNVSGSFNTALGTCAGSFITTGANNVAIGFCVQVPFGDQSNQLAIGFNAGFCWLTGCSNGNIRPAAGILDDTGAPGSTAQYLWSTGTGIRWSNASPSDARDKTIRGAIETALPLVNSIEAVSYNWKPRATGVEEQELVYGFVAQQLQEVDPVLVDSSDPEQLRIYDRKITPLLVRAIQELSEKVNTLQEKLDKLEANG
jgi:hypothetical protein